jgi:hypothetical protein
MGNESDLKYFMVVIALLLTMVLLLLSTSLLADSRTPCNTATPDRSRCAGRGCALNLLVRPEGPL